MSQPPEPRKGMPSPRLGATEFKQRFRGQFVDPAFDALQPELDRIAGAAWDAYAHQRKSPRTRKAGPGYADPDYDLAISTRRQLFDISPGQLCSLRDEPLISRMRGTASGSS